MTILLDRRSDGSMALYYDGDLQFDSRDERVYHEALTLPAFHALMADCRKVAEALGMTIG